MEELIEWNGCTVEVKCRDDGSIRVRLHGLGRYGPQLDVTILSSGYAIMVDRSTNADRSRAVHTRNPCDCHE